MIIGHVRGQELKLDRTTIAADSIKYLEAEFHFAGRDWDGYVKTAYFINGTSKFALVLADDRITADMGLNLTAGEWEVKLSGVKGDSRITTTTERIYVREFGSTDGTLPDVTATQAEQILAKIGDLSNLTTEAKANLVAAINEAAKSGGGSGGGKDGTGIASITYKGKDEDGGNVYTVLLTDGTSYDITAPKGDKGDKGDTGATGPQGPAGAPGKDGASMGITGATVGQTAKIAAVDASGVPTAWMPVDMPSGGGGETWELIASGVMAEAAQLSINKDNNSLPFSLKSALILVRGDINISQSSCMSVSARHLNSTKEPDSYSVEVFFFKENPKVNLWYVVPEKTMPMLYWENAGTDWQSADCKVLMGVHTNYADGKAVSNKDILGHLINDVKIGAVRGNGNMAAGCKWEIWGVRA